VAENLAQLVTQEPLTDSGSLSVAALMAWRDGENLIDADMNKMEEDPSG